MFILEENSYLYFLFLLPAFVLLFLWLQNWKKKATARFGDAHLVEKLIPNKSKYNGITRFIVLLFTTMLIVIGLSNPKAGTKTETIKTKGIEILFAIDVSKSMLAEDVAPNRLEKSKQIASQIINTLQGDKVGIIAYSGGAFPVLPITNDYGVAKMFLQTMSPSLISEQGTSIDQAIDLAEKSFNKKSRSNKLLLIISDGEDHSNDAESAAQTATKNGIKIITIGVGTEKGSPIPIKQDNVTQSLQRDKDGNVVITKRNPEVLKAIAKTSNENYIDGNFSKNAVETIKNRINKFQKTESTSVQVAAMPSQFQWFLGAALLLLVIDSLLLNRKSSISYKQKNKLLLCLTFLSCTVINAQQQDKNLPKGDTAFEQKKYAEAEAQYRTSQAAKANSSISSYNLGTSIYKQNQIAEAKNYFQKAVLNAKTKQEKHKAFHNLGNTLMKEKDFSAAAEAYKNALRNNPNDEQTRYNYALAKKNEKEQPPQVKDKNKDGNNKDQKPQEQQKKDQDKNKDNNDKEKQKDKQNNPNPNNEKDNQDKDEQKKGENNNPKPTGVSKQKFDNLLDAVNNEEKKVQEKINGKKAKVPIKTDKDW